MERVNNGRYLMRGVQTSSYVYLYVRINMCPHASSSFMQYYLNSPRLIPSDEHYIRIPPKW